MLGWRGRTIMPPDRERSISLWLGPYFHMSASMRQRSESHYQSTDNCACKENHPEGLVHRFGPERIVVPVVKMMICHRDLHSDEQGSYINRAAWDFVPIA